MSNYHYDAIVVGSGISGGWAAKELTEQGLKVLLLDRGRNIEHVKDYVNANKAPWEFPHRNAAVLSKAKDYPLLYKSGGLNESNLDYWVNEKESPYTQIKPYPWRRGYHVGGRSLMWGRQSYRWSDFDFEANLKEGIAVDWPVRYKDIAPWYDHAERFAGISGSLENLPQLPDGHFLPAMEMNCVEKDVSARIKKQYNGQRQMIIGRTANITTPLPGRTNCQYRNKCALGCPFGGYFSTQSSTLPAAMATGNLTVRPWSIVTQILYDKDTKKATGVEVLDAETNATYRYTSNIVFLNASTFNSAWILMNSATDVWPDGLGSSSGELGHNIMDHHMGGGATGIMEGYDDKYYFGRRANGIYIPRYRNLFNDKRNYQRGFGYQGSAGREDWSREIAELSIGAGLKEALQEPGSWAMSMVSFGEVLPYHENKLSLDKNNKDKWGLNILAVDAELKDNERKMEVDMENDAMEMLEKAGLKNVKSFERRPTMGAIHEMGSARMGNDPKTSVLNKWNQVWDAPNVFVTDGSFMASSSCVNPSLSYMAFTARAAHHAVEELKKMNI
ncbi:GMC oxidoreductase [Mucilaginibacter sp. SP1R1]|uniref:GMC oxidoreductase n=1 Tax=Mucilaginibacter sp. SP1R1 TaxID=2723091 RepID=UPI00160C9367|nr:GMC family oxidoreductase [Mucilaginibacter sp. SP1R1]MBB6149925.1 choline dehydrogenase-like flavoprotein [Mucilaginibacter sp. SP1R1]